MKKILLISLAILTIASQLWAAGPVGGIGGSSGVPLATSTRAGRVSLADITSSAKYNKGAALGKLRRAIAKANAANPVDGVVLASLPTITTTYDATLANFYTLNNLGTGPIAFNFLGGNPVDQGQVSGTTHGWVASAASYNGTKITSSYVLEFCTDAPKVQLRLAQGVCRIEVNGQFISKTGTLPPASGGEQSVIMDWGGARQTRTYRVHLAGGSFISRVGVDGQSRIWAPSYDDTVRVAWFGDSYTQGVGATYPDNGYADVASALLGFTDIWHSALGGTGYLNAGAYTTFRGHVADVTTANPDIVVLAGGTNDVSTNGVGIQAEVFALLGTLRASLPNTPIVVLGAWPQSTGPSSQMINVETAIAAAVSQFADPMCVFVPVCNDPTGTWMYGTGKVGATTGNGNADFYIQSAGVHPNDAGHDYLGRRAAQAIRNALQQMTP